LQRDVGIPLEPEGIHSQFRTSPGRKRPAPVSHQGDASRRTEVLCSTSPASLSFQTLRFPPHNSEPPKRLEVELPSSVELTVTYPSGLVTTTTPDSLLTRPAPRSRHVRPRSYPPRAALACCASQHSRAAHRDGRDVAIHSSAVIQLSMSTRMSADSHSCARRPNSVKSQIAQLRNSFFRFAPLRSHFACGGSSTFQVETRYPEHRCTVLWCPEYG
jgi:hypothetical protein